MATPINDKQKETTDQKEPRSKGGVAGTDSKDFDSSDPFKKEQKPDTDQQPK